MAQIYNDWGRGVEERTRARLVQLSPVKKAVRSAGRNIAISARGVLASHRHEHHAQILTMHGDADTYIVLDDARGLDAAMSIEFGRAPDDEGKGAMEPVAPLRMGAGMSVNTVRIRGR